MKIVSIASIPERKEGLINTIDSLYDQVHKIKVMLNGYKEVPKEIKRPNVKIFMLDNSLGASAKFFRSPQEKHYHFTCDDDIIYPEDYIERMVSKIEKYKRKACISCHGLVLNDLPLASYKHWIKNKHVFHFAREIKIDRKVHQLGTGCFAYHSDTVQFNHNDFFPSIRKNLVDMCVMIKLQKRRIGAIVISHKKGWLKYQQFLKHGYHVYKDNRSNPEITRHYLDSVNKLKQLKLY